MSESVLRQASTELRRTISDLRREAESLAEATAAGPDDEHDAEGATIGLERARVASILERAEQSLAALETAASRLAEGEYGRCRACGSPIAAERLEALPATELCFACAGGGPTG